RRPRSTQRPRGGGATRRAHAAKLGAARRSQVFSATLTPPPPPLALRSRLLHGSLVPSGAELGGVRTVSFRSFFCVARWMHSHRIPRSLSFAVKFGWWV